MLKKITFCSAVVLALFGNPASAEDYCDTYFVVKGDTLRLIAEQYYGSRDLSPLIYDANVETVGEDANLIEIGMELDIPCREGIQIPLSTMFVTIGDDPTLATPTDRPADPSPSFFALAGAAPFIDENNHGVLSDILTAALRNGDFVEDLTLSRPTTFAEVIARAVRPQAQLMFPIVQPQCETTGALSARSLMICEDFRLSEPLFQITAGLFTTAGGHLDGADTARAFVGKSICIAPIHADDLLRAHEIMSKGVLTTTEASLEACLNGLEAGKFDAVLSDYISIETAAMDGLVDLPEFAQQTTLHAAAYAENPLALQTLNQLNTGLNRILVSGGWFEIVKTHMPQRSN